MHAAGRNGRDDYMSTSPVSGAEAGWVAPRLAYREQRFVRLSRTRRSVMDSYLGGHFQMEWWCLKQDPGPGLGPVNEDRRLSQTIRRKLSARSGNAVWRWESRGTEHQARPRTGMWSRKPSPQRQPWDITLPCTQAGLATGCGLFTDNSARQATASLLLNSLESRWAFLKVWSMVPLY